MSDLVERLRQIEQHDWRVSFLAHTSDTAREARHALAACEAKLAAPAPEEVEALAKIAFEHSMAFTSTSPNAERWTWEMADEGPKNYWRGIIRALLPALLALRQSKT